jgi:dihydroflavonol-4-reductase
MILLTGGTGLLGSYLLSELISAGERVRVLVRPGKHIDELREILEYFGGSKGKLALIEWFEGDITDPFSLQLAMRGIEKVYHCAALVSFDPRDRKKMLKINVEGTSNVVNACMLCNVKKLCHVSSIASLGRPEQEGIIDELAKWKTSKRNSGYAISKYGAEREVWRGIEEGLDAVIVNPSVILGAGLHPKATNQLFHSIDKMIPFYNAGVNGYVDARDVAKAMIILMNSNVSGERYILNSENLSLRELFTVAAEILGKRPPFIPLGRPMLSLAWRLEWIRSRVTGKPALLTRENMRSARAKSFYSADKFANQFNYSFIPIRKTLEDVFLLLGKIEHKK